MVHPPGHLTWDTPPALLLTSGDHHWRPIETSSLEALTHPTGMLFYCILTSLTILQAESSMVSYTVRLQWYFAKMELVGLLSGIHRVCG